MRPIALVASLAICSTSFGAPASWKPVPSEVETAGDPRFAAVRAYERALAVVRVQSYLSEHQSAPGDREDLLITAFQETISGREIALATEFLQKYPDDAVASELLLFQINRTSGIWPPWKRLALALFDKCPRVIRSELPKLSPEKQDKFLSDVVFALNMSEGTTAIMNYPLNGEASDRLRSAVAEMRPKK